MSSRPENAQRVPVFEKKSLAQEVRQKGDILDLYFATQLLGHYATCQGLTYTKNEYNLFYHKLDGEYFLFNNFFKKKVFSEKMRGTFDDFFSERRHLVPKINIIFFYHKLGAEYFII